MPKLKIIQKRLHKNRQDSFWYEGLIATYGSLQLIVTGEVRLAFKNNIDNYYAEYQAFQEVLERNYYDEDFADVIWDMNNWFEIVDSDDVEDDDFGGSLEVSYYDEAIKVLKERGKEKYKRSK